jgi:hypothetical protein
MKSAGMATVVAQCHGIRAMTAVRPGDRQKSMIE